MTLLELKRREIGLKQIEVAAQIGMNKSLVSQVERLHRRPWPKLRVKLAEALGTHEGKLFDDDGWPKKVTAKM